MIGIAAISTEIPSLRLDTAPLAAAIGMAPETLEQRVGVRSIARKEAHQDTSHLCVAAGQKLFASGQVVRSEVDCVIVVTQNPDGCGLPQTSAIVHGKLGLPETCAAFDVGLGCSGYVYGLSIAKSFMEANGLRCGLLFTADPYSKIIDENDKRTALLFGDAATVTLLTDRPIWKIGKFDFGTQGAKFSAISRGDDGAGKLSMDGRGVLAFSMQQVPPSLHKAASSNALTLDQIDRFVLHQGSKVVVKNIGQRLKAESKTAFYAEEYGNTVSSSIPIVLSTNVPDEDRYIAISGFGVGLSWASTVLERVI
jgi:3-oxoacyl-[acyl-carrier-protein] synthase-3